MKLPRYILAIDPGPTESGWVEWDTKTKAPVDVAALGYPDAVRFEKSPNEEVIERLRNYRCNADSAVAIEMIASYGMAVGAEVFETCVWIGRFIEAAGEDRRVTRKTISLHHCNSPRANDGTVAQAVRDKYGQKGTKANPGPFYGVSGDVWQAIALATYIQETWVE